MEDSDEDSSWSSSSTSSGEKTIFKPAALPLVLELHDIRKDDPLMPKLKQSDSIPPLGTTGIKIKKHKKSKKKVVPGAKSNSSVSTASLSDTSSIAPSATDVKEEFYDAHESYHAIPENQIPVNLATESITQRNTNQDPANAPELVSKALELEAKAPESAANAPELAAKAPELAANAPELAAKASELAAKASELAAATSQPQKTKTTAAKGKSPVIKPTETP